MLCGGVTSDLHPSFEDEESALNNMSLTDLGADLMSDPALAEALQNMHVSDDNDSVFGGSTASTDIPRRPQVGRCSGSGFRNL